MPASPYESTTRSQHISAYLCKYIYISAYLCSSVCPYLRISASLYLYPCISLSLHDHMSVGQYVCAHGDDTCVPQLHIVAIMHHRPIVLCKCHKWTIQHALHATSNVRHITHALHMYCCWHTVPCVRHAISQIPCSTYEKLSTRYHML